MHFKNFQKKLLRRMVYILYVVFLLSQTYESNLYGSGQDVEKICDKDMHLSIKIGLGGRLSDVLGPRRFKSDEEIILKHDDVNIVYKVCMTQDLACTEIEFDEKTHLETILTTPDGAEIGFW